MFTELKVPFLNFKTIKISKRLILHYFYSFTIYTYVMYVDYIPRLSPLKNFSTPVRSLFPTLLYPHILLHDLLCRINPLHGWLFTWARATFQWLYYKNMILLPQPPLTSYSSSRRNGALVLCPLSIGLLTVLVSSQSCAGHHQCGAVSFWVKQPCHVQGTMFPSILPIVWLSISFVISHFLRFPESWWGLYRCPMYDWGHKSYLFLALSQVKSFCIIILDVIFILLSLKSVYNIKNLWNTKLLHYHFS